jgi:hypothetical protein
MSRYANPRKRFIGAPCRHHGPGVDRYRSSGKCCACQAERSAPHIRSAEYRAAKAAYDRAYRATHVYVRPSPEAAKRKRNKLRARKYVAANRERVREYQRKYYLKRKATESDTTSANF